MSAPSDALDAGLLQYTPGALIGTGGHIGTPNQQAGIRHVFPITTPEDLANVTVEDRDGAAAAARRRR